MNSKSIADAIAGQFVNITATNGTATETVTATASLPNNIATGPVLLVYPPTGTFEPYGVNKRRNGHLIYPVKLLRDPQNVPDRSDWLHAWINALIDEVGKHLTLGGLVAEAIVTGIRAEISGEQYSSVVTDPSNPGTVAFDVVELTVDVSINEIVSSMAP